MGPTEQHTSTKVQFNPEQLTHPHLMGFLAWGLVTIIGRAVIWLCPALVGAVAGMLPFAAVGVAAGCIAAAVQSPLGSAAADFILSLIQTSALASPFP